MKRISMEEVSGLLDRIAEINSLPFDEIEWTENGEVIPYKQQLIDAWKDLGLNNTDFVGCKYGKFNA